MRKDTAIIYYNVEALEEFLYFNSRDLCSRSQIPCSLIWTQDFKADVFIC